MEIGTMAVRVVPDGVEVVEVAAINDARHVQVERRGPVSNHKQKKKKNPRKISSERNLSPTHADHDAAQVPFEGYALSPA
jgi:hypothetical protein